MIFFHGWVGRVSPLRAARLQRNGAQRTDAPTLQLHFGMGSEDEKRFTGFYSLNIGH